MIRSWIAAAIIAWIVIVGLLVCLFLENFDIHRRPQ